MAEDDETGDSGGTFPGFDFARTLQQVGHLSAASVGMWSSWAKTWETVMRERGWPALDASLRQAVDPTAALGGTAGGPGGLGDALEQAFGLPRLADMMSVDLQAFRVLEPSVELLQVGRDYSLVAGQVWAETGRRFQARLEELRKDGRGLESAGDVLDLWNNVVDEAMIEFNRSNKFAELQRRFLRATMRHRLEQRRLAERVCELYDLPTRAEVDELHRKVHDLQRKLRRAASAAPAPAAAKPQQRRRRAASRSKSASG